ncbi:MAG: DUF2232 domain-containing protein [Alphaproteobacteria bacterium]|nr:DUF2232 domain-containing protein [Alphaproteobacteria bacterium]
MDRLGSLGAGALLGAIGACLYLSILTGSPGALILAYLAQLPFFAAGLWFGVRAAVSAGVVASVILFAAGGATATGGFAALYAAPVVVLVRQALLARQAPDGTIKWYPAGLLSAWLTGLGLIMLGAIILVLGGPTGIETFLNDRLGEAIQRLGIESGSSGEALTKTLALVMPGAVTASWMAMTASNGVLAQGVLARFGKAWRPSPDLAALALPFWLSALLALAAALVLCGGAARFVGINLLIVLVIPFCLAGLAMLHTVVRRLPRPQVPLILFYVLAGLFGWPLLIITILGMLDAPLGLRRRFAPAQTNGVKIDD